MTRDDDFLESTKETIARRVNYLCSMRNCRMLTSGPRTASHQSVSIGMAAHITAAAPKGPRYDASLTPEQRRAPENGIWMCYNHGKLVDNDTDRYTADDLRAMKQDAEQEATAALERGSVQHPQGGSTFSPTITIQASVIETRPSRTILRLQFPGNDRIPRSVHDENIHGWCIIRGFGPATITATKVGTPEIELSNPARWHLFITFDRASSFPQLFVGFDSPGLPQWKEEFRLSRMVVLTFFGSIPAGTMEISSS